MIWILLGTALILANFVALIVLVRRPSMPNLPLGLLSRPDDEPSIDLSKQEKHAQAEFEKMVADTTKEFSGDLNETSKHLNQLIVRLTTEVVERELQQYRQSLIGARTAALQSLMEMQKAVESKQHSLESELDVELKKHQEQLLAKFDRKLGETVSTYIVESLGQGADLGAQRTFLFDSLERNKEAIKKDLSDG